ncbi:6946_t:CDS:2, partial [Rhizophagus irregularis]
METFLNEALIASNYSNEYFILFCADNVKKLESLNDTEVVTTGEVNLEQLMVELVGGTEITEDRQVKFTDDIKNLNELYNAAVDVID